MIESLGLLEVYGLASGIDAMDAMLKSANVRMLNYQVVIPGRVILAVTGDLAACRAALEAGVAAASRSGRVFSHKVIGRPDGDTQWPVAGFSGIDHTAVAPGVSAETAIPAGQFRGGSSAAVNNRELSDNALLALVAKAQHRYGATAGEVASHFGCQAEECRAVMERLAQQGRLRKRGSRYRVK